MQALKCCRVTFYILSSNNLLFNPGLIIAWLSLTIVLLKTNLCEKVQN